MGKRLKFCAMLATAAIIFGCASKQENEPVEERAQVRELMPGYSTEPVAANPHGQNVVNHAKRAIGTPYVLGGSAPGGFDCSGLVKWAYNRIGVDLPRTAREQSTVGQKINDVKDMQAGDIVAFRHPKRGYHTGIYVGDGKFIHSPRKRSRVKINSLSDPYFNSTLLGARRVAMDGSPVLVADAQSKLGEYIAARSQKALASQNQKATASIQAKQKTRNSRIAKKSAGKTAIAAKKSSGKTTVAAKKSSKTTAAKKAGATKTVAANSKIKQAANKKTTAAKTVAQHNVKSKTAASKKTAAKTKTVSMLQQKSRKAATRSRNHS